MKPTFSSKEERDATFARLQKKYPLATKAVEKTTKAVKPRKTKLFTASKSTFSKIKGKGYTSQQDKLRL